MEKKSGRGKEIQGMERKSGHRKEIQGMEKELRAWKRKPWEQAQVRAVQSSGERTCVLRNKGLAELERKFPEHAKVKRLSHQVREHVS
jgi:hypothetical protein